MLAERPALLAARTGARGPTGAPRGGTGLHLAVHADRPDVIRVLLDAGIDPDVRNAAGRTALHDAIEGGRRQITELLIDGGGATVDICAAAILGRLERLRQLLGEDPSRANDRSTGLSPLGWAAFGNRVTAAAVLIDRGARMDDGELLCAASAGHVEVGRLLLDRGVDPDAIDPGAGGTALHAAAAMRYTPDARPFVRMLLGRGANPRIRDRKGRTPAGIAEARAAGGGRCPFAEIAAILGESGG